MDELRISDIIRYTESFTPPTDTFLVDANTAALYHFDGDATDTTGQNDGTYNLIPNDNREVWSEETPDLTPDTVPPVILGDPAVSDLTGNNATLSWTTDEASQSQVRYGTTSGDYTNITAWTITLTTNPSITLSSLLPDTTYYFQVRSRDGASPPNESAWWTEGSLTTLEPDTTPPSILPPGVTVDAASDTATLTFTTDEISEVEVRYGTTSGSLDQLEVWNGIFMTDHNIILSNLLAETTYFYQIRLRDTAVPPNASAWMTEANFTTLAAPTYPPDAIAIYSFDDTTQDISGNANDGTLVSGATFTQDGQFESALDLTGVDGYVEVADSASLDLGTQFTVSGWFDSSNSSPWSGMIYKKQNWADSDGWAIGRGGSAGDLWISGSGGGVEVACVSDWETAGWVHVAVVYDGSTATVYCNGTQTAQVDIAPVVDNDVNMRIGSTVDGSDASWEGSVDEVAVFNRSLTSEEIVSLMNGPFAPIS